MLLIFKWISDNAPKSSFVLKSGPGFSYTSPESNKSSAITWIKFAFAL